MKPAGQIILLGVFAAAGVGLAVGVGLSGNPPAAEEQASASQLAVRVVTEREPAADDGSGGKSSGRATIEPPAEPRTPRGPLFAAVHPPQAQQFVPADDKTRLEQAYEFLSRELGRQPPPGEEVPPPPPANTDAAVSAEPLPLSQPNVGSAASSPSGPRAKGEALSPRAVVDAEGDGKLSIHIQNSELREVLNLLSEEGNLNILAGNSVQGKVSATLSGVDIDSALDAILKSTGYIARREGKFIFVGTPEEFTKLEESLDKIGMRVYRPNYVTAVDLQKLIQPLVTEKVGAVSLSTPAEAGIASDANKAGGNTYAGGDVVVVRDYEAVLTTIDQMVSEVDVRPMQVHIEAMILSVKLKDTDRYGVDFQLLRNQPHIKFGLGTPANSLGDVKFEQGSLKFGFLDSSLGAFLNALESIGDTNVIATPRLMVINKQRAEIQIGQQIGYVSTTVTETSSTQAVQFLEVGALLRLRPFISTDGLIRMEIHPELSDGSVKTESGFTLPQKEVTQVTTNIMVRDGCTVVIGGLMRENLASTRAQIPFLGSLPLIGFVFRTSTETTERHEVLVLITPHIVYDRETDQEGDQAACEFFRRQSLYADKMSPFNKRSLGRRYFRLAQSAWAAGDRDNALRFAELSVHFDPLSRAAIDLRSDIWLGKPSGDHTLGTTAPEGPLASPLDDAHLADWLINDLEHEPAAQQAAQQTPLHPLDPGQPGRQKEIVRPRRLQ